MLQSSFYFLHDLQLMLVFRLVFQPVLGLFLGLVDGPCSLFDHQRLLLSLLLQVITLLLEGSRLISYTVEVFLPSNQQIVHRPVCIRRGRDGEVAGQNVKPQPAQLPELLDLLLLKFEFPGGVSTNSLFSLGDLPPEFLDG
jgi:hypothetical protein